MDKAIDDSCSLVVKICPCLGGAGYLSIIYPTLGLQHLYQFSSGILDISFRCQEHQLTFQWLLDIFYKFVCCLLLILNGIWHSTLNSLVNQEERLLPTNQTITGCIDYSGYCWKTQKIQESRTKGFLRIDFLFFHFLVSSCVIDADIPFFS